MTNAEKNKKHPLILNCADEAGKDLLLFDNTNRVPIYDAPCVSSNLVIVFCHKGTTWDKDTNLNENEVSFLLPNQVIYAYKSSDDYLATALIVSQKLYEQLVVNYPYTRHTPHFRRKPVTHFSSEQFNNFLHVLDVLRALLKLKNVNREQLILNQLHILVSMIAAYRSINDPEERTITKRTLLFNNFYEAIVKHYQDSHEMAYYAKLLHFSPKHFATLIKSETGISATEWIENYIIIQAKLLLYSRRDLTIQQISFQLGFTKQASFSRYFRASTGLSPTEYRKTNMQ